MKRPTYASFLFVQRIPRVQYTKLEHFSCTTHLQEEEYFLEVANFSRIML